MTSDITRRVSSDFLGVFVWSKAIHVPEKPFCIRSLSCIVDDVKVHNSTRQSARLTVEKILAAHTRVKRINPRWVRRECEVHVCVWDGESSKGKGRKKLNEETRR